MESKQISLFTYLTEDEKSSSLDFSVPENSIITERVCIKCKVKKPLTDFNFRKDSPDGRFHYCRDCANKNSKEWRNSNHNRVLSLNRRNHLIDRAGIKIDDIELLDFIIKSLREIQSDKCPICERLKSPKKDFNLDHNHNSSEINSIRGLLCDRCNYVLRYFEDPKLLKKVHDYLNNPPFKQVDISKIKKESVFEWE
jgi:hypothetical protein